MSRLRCDACGYTWTPAAISPTIADDDEAIEAGEEDSFEALPEEDASAVCPSCGAEVHAAH